DVLAIAARSGYTGLELFGVPNHLPSHLPEPRVRDARLRCDDLGLKVITLCTYVGGFAEASDTEASAELETYRRYVGIANLLGCDLIRLWPDHLGRNLAAPREDHWLRAAHYLREAADIGLRAGTRVLIENHKTMTVNVDLSLRLIHLIGRPNVVFNFDPGNMCLAGEEYGRAAVLCFNQRIGNVQVKEVSPAVATAGSTDATLAAGGSYDLLLGEGTIDHQSYLGALAEIGYDGYYMAECHKTPTAEWPSDRIAEHESRALRTLLEQIAAAKRRPTFV
ncbi:MAG TPA: sugar phosphate isomerase/epimerase family protein, partial [Chloroflexota bacterium]|nr:sugar phosphate isomerase/epimerase family protein [Chloroflexota bacterium]